MAARAVAATSMSWTVLGNRSKPGTSARTRSTTRRASHGTWGSSRAASAAAAATVGCDISQR
jgi:hypothetical protein